LEEAHHYGSNHYPALRRNWARSNQPCEVWDTWRGNDAGMFIDCICSGEVARPKSPDPRTAQENAVAMKGGSKKKVVAFVFASNATGQRKTPGNRKPVRVEETPFTIILYAFFEEGPIFTILSVVCVFNIRSSLVQRISHETGKRSSFLRLCTLGLVHITRRRIVPYYTAM
jgi:hypothetical protein